MVAGIAMVHQHFMLIPVFTVAEKLSSAMSRPVAFGFLDHRKARRLVAECPLVTVWTSHLMLRGRTCGWCAANGSEIRQGADRNSQRAHP